MVCNLVRFRSVPGYFSLPRILRLPAATTTVRRIYTANGLVQPQSLFPVPSTAAHVLMDLLEFATKDLVATKLENESAILESDDSRPIYEIIEFPPSTEPQFALERFRQYMFPLHTGMSRVECRRCAIMRNRVAMRRVILNDMRSSNEKADGRVRRILRRAIKAIREFVSSRQRYNQ